MATYRAATAAGVFANTVFGIILASVMVAVFDQRPEIGGFDVTDAVTFTFVGQGMLMVVGIFGSFDQSDEIASGDVAVELSRPYDYQAWWGAVWLGKAGYYAIFRGVPPFLAGGLLFELRVPTSPSTWAAFAVSVLLASLVAYAFGFIISCIAFWIVDVRGPSQLLWFSAQWLGGVFVPIVLFPEAWVPVARALPFASMFQLPIEVFLEVPDGAGLARTWALQLGWFVALVAVGRLVLAAGSRKLVVQGG